MPTDPQPKANTRGLGKLLIVVALAFAFTFSLVPLYRVACEKVFGVKVDKGPAKGAKAKEAADPNRWITVEFDGVVNSKLPWTFHPNTRSMKVQVGKQYETSYFAKNISNAVVVGNAVPSVEPARGSGYFNKTECFCFTEQKLAAGETKDMPVRFIVDPALPADVKTLTLSYVFYQNDSLTESVRHAAAGKLPSTAHTAP